MKLTDKFNKAKENNAITDNERYNLADYEKIEQPINEEITLVGFDTYTKDGKTFGVAITKENKFFFLGIATTDIMLKTIETEDDIKELAKGLKVKIVEKKSKNNMKYYTFE